MNIPLHLAAAAAGVPASPRLPGEVIPLPKRERLLRLPEVQDRCGIKKSTIYALMKKGQFPALVQCGPRAVAWPESRIDAWIAARLEAANKNALDEVPA